MPPHPTPPPPDTPLPPPSTHTPTYTKNNWEPWQAHTVACILIKQTGNELGGGKTEAIHALLKIVCVSYCQWLRNRPTYQLISTTDQNHRSVFHRSVTFVVILVISIGMKPALENSSAQLFQSLAPIGPSIEGGRPIAVHAKYRSSHFSNNTVYAGRPSVVMFMFNEWGSIWNITPPILDWCHAVQLTYSPNIIHNLPC